MKVKPRLHCPTNDIFLTNLHEQLQAGKTPLLSMTERNEGEMNFFERFPSA